MLESGLGGDQSQLAAVEEHLARRNVVCAYDRAGIGDSDSSLKTTRRVTEVVADLDAFVAAADIDPPHFLVGHSVGGMLVFMYAQAHPDTVAGFVSMNPVPPYKTFIEAARKVESKDEIATELAQYRGENYEDIDSRANERMLTDPLPPAMPYAVMFDEDCDGDAEFCRRIFPPLERTTRALAKVGGGGRFVPAKGAGHNIFETDPELVLKTIDDVLKDAAGN